LKRLANHFVPLLALLIGWPGISASSQISSGSSDQCVNVPWHGAPVEGTPVHVKQCDPRQNQQWIISMGQITGVGGLCLDVQGGQSTDGARVIYVSCNRAPSQNWRLSNGQIVGIGGKCLGVAGGVPTDGALLIIASCSNAPDQQWTVH
jgi:hypothetical protein